MNGGLEVMRLLLEQDAIDIQITENVFKVAAENGECGVDIVRLFLKKGKFQAKIGQEIVEAAARNLEADKFEITGEVVEAAMELFSPISWRLQTP